MRLLLSFTLLALTLCSFAESKIVLSPPTYDFGVMKEVAGPRTGRVFVRNLGPDPTFIRQVRPSCGCTDADFQQGEIAPGDSAWVSFTYNPAGRPGRFEKTVRVVLGEDSQKELINIRGIVLGTPETLDKMYPVDAGPLRLKEDKIFFESIKQGSTRHFFISGYNMTPDTIAPRLVCDNKAVDVGMTPEKVAPGELVTFSFYLNTRRLDTIGRFQIPVMLYPEPANQENIAANSKNKDENAVIPHEIIIFAEIIPK